ncbi:hypothetical protein BDZ97DRAFT_351646 [Flammula alnicola]|nr:hypothetical protein BDZ97DRAFT_1080535 [Flammula alnicola]KAF8968457.1 hypothetical protein BDZ97DRAFT_351646 [Flammula alnicola]
MKASACYAASLAVNKHPIVRFIASRGLLFSLVDCKAGPPYYGHHQQGFSNFQESQYPTLDDHCTNPKWTIFLPWFSLRTYDHKQVRDSYFFGSRLVLCMGSLFPCHPPGLRYIGLNGGLVFFPRITHLSFAYCNYPSVTSYRVAVPRDCHL